MWRRIRTTTAAWIAVAAWAGGAALAGQPPGPPQAYLDSFPRRGSEEPLVLGFCMIGAHACVERTALAWGQVCDSDAARTIGDGASGDVVGGRPWILRYAGWRCGPGGAWHDRSERVFGGGNWGGLKR